MSDSQEPEGIAEPADGTALDAGATTAAPEPVPIGGFLWIPGIFLGFVTLLMFGTVARSSQVPGKVSALLAAIQVVNVILPVFVTIKFFQRRRYVPLLIIGGSLVKAVQVIGFGPEFPPRTIAIVFGTAALLVCYFSLSKRVKRTFVL